MLGHDKTEIGTRHHQGRRETGPLQAQRRALERLTDPEGLGRIQVMGLRAGGVESLPGLEPDES